MSPNVCYTLALMTVFLASAPAWSQTAERATTADLRLRAGPSLSTPVLDVIPEGTPVPVATCESGWCAIAFRDQSGFAFEEYLSADSIGLVTPALTAAEAALVSQHVYGGTPACTGGRLLVRQGYVNCYDPARRVPRWVAYYATRDYFSPPREGRFARFRTDPDIPNAVTEREYTNSGYDRGHLAPFAVMGGDRDGDGRRAALVEGASDADDEQTVFEAMFMSNMAPQRGLAFNQTAGVWWRVEALVRNRLVGDPQRGRPTWVVAGTVFGPGTLDRIGPDDDIQVPPLFYQITVQQPDPARPPVVLAFLIPHHQAAHGDIEDFLVSVDVVEALTGLDFFSTLPDAAEQALEERDSWEAWVGQLYGPKAAPTQGVPGRSRTKRVG